MRRIDEILALPHMADDFKSQEVPPSDDDSWLYSGEDELNTALQERQKELELYTSKLKSKQKSDESQDTGPSAGKSFDDFDPRDMADTMKTFVHKVSSYKGAEVPENRLVYLCLYLFLLQVYILILSIYIHTCIHIWDFFFLYKVSIFVLMSHKFLVSGIVGFFFLDSDLKTFLC